MLIRKFITSVLLGFTSLTGYSYIFSSALLESEAQPYSYQSSSNIEPSVAAIIAPSPMSKKGRPVFVGSSILKSRLGEKYYVLTNEHVVKQSSSYQVMTPDGQLHDATIDKRMTNKDIAILTFNSTNDYAIADTTNNTGYALRGDAVFINSWIESSYYNPSCQRIGRYSKKIIVCPKLVQGSFNGFISSDRGYDVGYEAQTEFGMSGGLVTNSRGDFIAMHGRRGKGISILNW